MSFKKVKTEFSIFVAKLFVKLPSSWLLSFGRGVGYLVYYTSGKRSKVAKRNIELCFPERNENEQKLLLKQNLASTGQGIIESMIAYWGSSKKCSNLFEIKGLGIVNKSLQDGKGCLLLSYHHHLIELACRVINQNLSAKANMLVRQHNNKIFESHVDQARKSHCEKTIDKKDMKSVLRSLKSNSPVFYVPDQNFSYQFEYIDFFNQPAATVLAPARIAQITSAPVIPWSAYRKRNGKCVIEFKEPLSDFGEKDSLQSLKLMNHWFEIEIRKNPEQYLWVHRRFKNHPDGKNSMYQNL